MAEKYEFGLVGLGVMGRNFILNVADQGFSAIGLDTDEVKVEELTREAGERKVRGTTDKEFFVSQLTTPRKIMMLVPAGAPVDSVIEDLLPMLSKGDLLIDGGNTFFRDTNRRSETLHKKGIHYFGTGVSGGAKGARYGPSIMPGGDREAYEAIRPIFEAAAAKVNGEPCVDYMGSTSAGNYVKMVHNGIEYGLMQLISEIYDVMKRGLGMNNVGLAAAFTDWNKGRLQSFLLEITAEIFQKKDDETGQHLVDVILDKAKQKGTGKWTSQNAMDLGIAIPTIDSAVSMREISSQKDLRVQLEKDYPQPEKFEKSGLSLEDLEKTLYFAFIITYSQGMSQLSAASDEYAYDLDPAIISKIWRGGCIIRAALLEDMRIAYVDDPRLSSLLLHKIFQEKIHQTVNATRSTLKFGIDCGIPTMSLTACLNYYDAIRSGRLPLNLIQAQRDHFGSHTYERVDRNGVFHSEW